MDWRFMKKGGLQFVEYRMGADVKAYTTTRQGLAMSGCNLYKAYDLKNGQESFQRACATLGIEPKDVATNRLIQHTNLVREANEAEANIYNEPSIVRADGLITQSNHVVLYLYASDCALVFLRDLQHKAIGFCHAGWRGTVRGVIQNTIYAMQQAYGTDPANLLVAIGPTVSQPFCGLAAQEAQEFYDGGLERFVRYTPGRYVELRQEREDCSPWPAAKDVPDYYVDLVGADLAILQQAGVKSEHIMTTGLCTYERSDLFHSYFRGPINADGYHLTGVNGSFFWLE